MIVLGADLATRSGVTYDRPDGSVVHDSHRCPGAREGDYGPLFLSFDVWWCRTLAAALPAPKPRQSCGFRQKHSAWGAECLSWRNTFPEPAILLKPIPPI